MGSLYFLKDRKLLYFAIALSLFIHLLITLKHFEMSQTSIRPALDKEDVSKILLKLKSKKQKQIVNTIKSENKKKPVDSKFLSKEDNYFYRQTRSKRVDRFTKGAKGNNKLIDSPLNQKKTTLKKERVDLSKFSFNPLTAKTKPVKKQKAAPEIRQARKGTKYGDIKERGVASNNDFIQDLPLGEFSRLNTQEYRFYGFYFRIRQQLEQRWGVSLKEKAKQLYKRGGRLPASQNLITDLEITLDDQGKITGVHISSSSGVKELDEAATESFNKAGPFPNPPKEMLQNGVAKIKWGFVVKGRD